LKPEHIIDETATIQETDIEDVYDRSIEWLSGIGAEMLEEVYPSFIKASHKGTRGYYEDWGKEITLSLSQDSENVVIRVIMDEREKNPLVEGIENRRRSWLKLVESLWELVDVALDDETLTDLYSETSLEKMIGDHKKRAWFWVFVLGFVIILVLVYPPIATQASIPAFFTIIILMGEAYTVIKYQRRHRELYPNR
jgi:hypothetical protein